jgi:hypothetical protein
MNRFIPLLFIVGAMSAEVQVQQPAKSDTPQTTFVPSATAYQGGGAGNDATAVCDEKSL